MASRLKLFLALSFVAAVGCPSPSHPAPVYEPDPSSAATPTPTAGHEEQAPATDQLQHGAVERPFLYVVRSTEPPSYLFGTVHVGVSIDEALPGPTFDALADSRVVLVEIDPATVSAQAFADAARLPRRAETLDRRLPSLLWHDLTEELSDVMLPDGLRQMRPWFAMVMLMQRRVAAMHGGAPPEAMDLSIVQYAREQGIEVAALESVRDQIAAFGAIPDAQTLRELREMLEDPQAAQAKLAQMLEAYRQGDEQRMAQLLFDPAEMEAAPEMYEQLFTRRNEAWLARIEREIEAGGAFVAVGAGHLLGDDGLVAQLRERGFPVERVD